MRNTNTNKQHKENVMKSKAQIMKTAWQIRKAAAAKFGVKVSEILFAPCLRMAWSQPMSNLTATANGVKFDATTHQAKCNDTPQGTGYSTRQAAKAAAKRY